jgi:uncharacterized membrane protein YhaH (DUF805 family)
MLDNYLNVMKNHYADFSGRARRSEYWYFGLVYFIIMFLVVIVFGILALIASTTISEDFGVGIMVVGYLVYFVVILAHMLPAIALTIRRLHDSGKSGWFYFVSMIPFIGNIWLLVLYCTDSEVNENKWGVNPKA